MWAARRARAAQLLREAPHAEQLLVFYVQLTEIQERVAQRVPVDAWLARVPSEAGMPPRLGVERIPPQELVALFEGFLDGLTSVGTDVIQAGSLALLADNAATRLGPLTQRTGFHARAFLESVMTTLANAPVQAHDPRMITGSEAGRCFRCGSLPVLAVLRDQPEVMGARSLVCSLCATEWRFDRLRCAHCGERGAENLVVHNAESVPHVRLDTCRTCDRYIKTVDLRQRGDAIPVVDELATIELDVWARDRGLAKLQPNVLEL